MKNFITCFFFALMVPSFALPSTFRAVIDDRDRVFLSAAVVKGIVVGIVALIIIPCLWVAYKRCNRSRPTPRPLFIQSPPIFTNPAPNSNAIPLSGKITRPRPVHTKVNAPTYGA